MHLAYTTHTKGTAPMGVRCWNLQVRPSSDGKQSGEEATPHCCSRCLVLLRAEAWYYSYYPVRNPIPFALPTTATAVVAALVAGPQVVNCGIQYDPSTGPGFGQEIKRARQPMSRTHEWAELKNLYWQVYMDLMIRNCHCLIWMKRCSVESLSLHSICWHWNLHSYGQRCKWVTLKGTSSPI